MFGRAQVVVLGQVAAIEEGSPNTDRRTPQSVTLTVDRCYKPSNECGSTVVFHRTMCVTCPQVTLRAGDSVIAFIESPDAVLLQPPIWSVWPAGWINLSGDRSAASGEELLEADLATGLTSGDENVRMRSLLYLLDAPTLSPAAFAEVRSIAEGRSGPMGERLAALAILLNDPRPEYVGIAAKMAATRAGVVEEYPQIAAVVGLRLARAKDPETVPSLVTIFDSGVEWWHHGAISALRNMHSPSLVRIFVQALDDPDRATQHAAVLALAQTTGKFGDFAPARDLFDKDPESYIQRWKQWWQTQGQAEFGHPAQPNH